MRSPRFALQRALLQQPHAQSPDYAEQVGDVDLAAALQMETTAEGVETEDQLSALKMQGCGNIQGYLFSRPVEGAQVAGLLGSPLAAKVA